MEAIERAVELQDRDAEALVIYATAFSKAKETLETAHRRILETRAASKEFYADEKLARVDRICTKLLAAFEKITRPESDGAR